MTWTALVSAGLSAPALADPTLLAGVDNERLHLAIVMAQAMIGLLAAYLVVGRLRRWRRLDHLLLAAGLGFLGVSNLLFAAVPVVVDESTGAYETWGVAAGRLGGAVLLACAALVSPRRLRLTRRQCFFSTLAIVDALAAVAVAVAATRAVLPQAVTAGGEANDAYFAIAVLTALVFVVASVAFAVRARQTRDALQSALAVGCALAMAALVNSVAVWDDGLAAHVGLSDALRFGFYLVILGGVLHELDAHWRSTLAAAALDERRRMARDLHDGLAQELASIQRNLNWLDPDDPFVARALAGAERGLAGARQAIRVLGDAPDRDLAELLAETAVAVASRVGTELVLDLEPSVEVGPAEREALVRITAEAISNAARHGGADVVRVELVDRPRVRLRISDSGRGFNPALLAWAGREGFGLGDMQDRALEIGARYRLDSQPGKGTHVEVAL